MHNAFKCANILGRAFLSGKWAVQVQLRDKFRSLLGSLLRAKFHVMGLLCRLAVVVGAFVRCTQEVLNNSSCTAAIDEPTVTRSFVVAFLAGVPFLSKKFNRQFNLSFVR